MTEAAEMWRDINRRRQDKRAANRDSSAEVLTREGIAYGSKNMGAHLIVSHDNKTVDFWPGTGRWIDRVGRKGFGVRSLVDHMKADALIAELDKEPSE